MRKPRRREATGHVLLQHCIRTVTSLDHPVDKRFGLVVVRNRHRDIRIAGKARLSAYGYRQSADQGERDTVLPEVTDQLP